MIPNDSIGRMQTAEIETKKVISFPYSMKLKGIPFQIE